MSLPEKLTYFNENKVWDRLTHNLDGVRHTYCFICGENLFHPPHPHSDMKEKEITWQSLTFKNLGILLLVEGLLGGYTDAIDGISTKL